MTPVELLLALNKMPDASMTMEDVIRALTLIRSTESLDEISALFAHRFFDPFVIDSRVMSCTGEAGLYHGLMKTYWQSLVGSAGLQRPWRTDAPYGVAQAEPDMEIRMTQWLHHGLCADLGGKDSSRQTSVVFQTLLDWVEQYPWSYDPVLASAIQYSIWPVDMLQRVYSLSRPIGPLALGAMAERALRATPSPASPESFRLPSSFSCDPSLMLAWTLVHEQTALIRDLYSLESRNSNISRYVPIVAEQVHAMLNQPGSNVAGIELPTLDS